MTRAFLLWAFTFSSLSMYGQSAVVPFVACPSDGQTGPVAAPRGHARHLAIPPEAAAHLAWYEAASSPGVLGPRGWHCFSTYGSNGATLYISPEPLNAKLVFSDGWKGFSGPAIEISSMNGGTLGRFEVARMIARLFPEHMDFTRSVIAEDIEPARDFPRGPYPTDKLTYKTKTLVEFETPARSKGLGTDSRLQPADRSITGFVYLSMKPDDDPFDISLEMRLPSDLSALGPIIQTATERTQHAIPAR